MDKKNHWTDKNGKMFFPVKVMSAVFKKHYLNELKALWETNQLEYHGSSEHLKNHYEFKVLLDKLYSKEWIVYTKQAFNGAKSVINYLGRYTHRIAISNRFVNRGKKTGRVYFCTSSTESSVCYAKKNNL